MSSLGIIKRSHSVFSLSMHASVHDHILKGCGHSTLQTARRTYLQLHCSWGQRRTDYILRSKDQFSVKTRPNIAKKSLNQKMHLSGKCILVDLDDKCPKFKLYFLLSVSVQTLKKIKTVKLS